MNKVAKFACLLALVGAVCVNAFGWGNATHVYLAHHLGAKFGVMNAAEMYGVLLPDIFGTQFDPLYFQLVDHEMHYNYQAARDAASTWRLKAEAFAIATHNEGWGADWTAHIKGIPPGKFPNGYVVDQAILLSPKMAEYLINDLNLPSSFPTGLTLAELAVLLSHDVIESSIDILVRRCLDPLVGLRLATAAQIRPPETGKMLATAYGYALSDYLSDEEIMATFVAAEAKYQEAMIMYGQLYTLPEAQLIETLSLYTAELAQGVISVLTGGSVVVVDPQKVAYFLSEGIAQVKPTFAQEIASTMEAVERKMQALHIRPEYPMFAEADEGVNSDIFTATVPADFSLEQNYPNPFNPSTTISYALPKDCMVTLKVYNSIGQEVATLLDGPESAGVHSISWNASNLSSGVYFYRMTAGEFTSVKRLTLLK